MYFGHLNYLLLILDNHVSLFCKRRKEEEEEEKSLVQRALALLKRRNEIINHKDLSSFWNKFSSRNDFEQLCQNLIELMENFEVCFVLEEDKQKPFSEQRSLVPSLLPSSIPSQLETSWLKSIPYDTVEINKGFQFNVILNEMVSRLFVRLHTFMGEKMIWREGIYFLKGGQQGNQDELKGLLASEYGRK